MFITDIERKMKRKKKKKKREHDIESLNIL